MDSINEIDAGRGEENNCLEVTPGEGAGIVVSVINVSNFIDFIKIMNDSSSFVRSL